MVKMNDFIDKLLHMLSLKLYIDELESLKTTTLRYYYTCPNAHRTRTHANTRLRIKHTQEIRKSNPH